VKVYDDACVLVLGSHTNLELGGAV